MMTRRRKKLKTIYDFFREHDCTEIEKRLILGKLAELRYLALFKAVLR